MMYEQLKPCPFCGSNNTQLHYDVPTDVEENENENAFILCGDCLIETGCYHSRGIIIKKWNHRKCNTGEGKN